MPFTDYLRKRRTRATSTDPLPSSWRLAAAALILAGMFLALIVLLGHHH